MLSTAPFSIDVIGGELENMAASCGLYGEFDMECWEAKLQSPEVISKMNEAAKNLVNTFAI
jgi:hypothetical protein